MYMVDLERLNDVSAEQVSSALRYGPLFRLGSRVKANWRQVNTITLK